ncbi:MAG: GNAT family N-acetyltransferase [Candidatus Thiodiazotropha sp. (ex Monitilora ramsayi)]|nr:GNAT family N-acetyltransferase [Candidatus Thiodiazotropha sp. (ex Monitilora ramsayi)]
MCEIRQATEKDYAFICRLVTSKSELYRIYPGGSYPLTIEQLSEIAKVRSDLSVVTQENRIIGFANLYNFEANHSAFIGNVIVDRKQRGRGIGKRLVRHMLGLAFDKHRLSTVKISVFGDNSSALLLYTSLGFRPYAVEERINPEGRRTALIHMRIDHQGGHSEEC